jgi:hypothetical protein
MEFAVYDGPNRRAGTMVMIGLIFGLLGSLCVFLLIPHPGKPIPAESYLPLMVPVALIIAVFPLISVITGVQIRIERQTNEVLRLWSIFGYNVRTQSFRLADFERVSLSRAFRRGYQVALIGPQQDLTVFLTPNLAAARDHAQGVASACGLKIADHL